jgi:hypothetical protein
MRTIIEIIQISGGHLQISQDLTEFWISFSNEKGVSRVQGPMDCFSGRSIVDHGHGRAARSPALSALLPRAIGIRHGMMDRKRDPRGSSPRVANGRGAMDCERRQGCDGGGDLLSTTGGLGLGETKVGAALDAVESGQGVGAFYRAVEFYSSLVSKELMGEEETGRHQFGGGSEGGMMVLRFGSSRTEEGGSRRRTAWWHGRRGGGADGRRSWDLMEAGGGSRLRWRGCCDWADA